MRRRLRTGRATKACHSLYHTFLLHKYDDFSRRWSTAKEGKGKGLMRIKASGGKESTFGALLFNKALQKKIQHLATHLSGKHEENLRFAR